MVSPPQKAPGPPPRLPPSYQESKEDDEKVQRTFIDSIDDIPEDPAEMEKRMSRERIMFFQELEMDRVLSAFKLNPYDVLECPMEADQKTITKIYRKKSLLIHPDKVKDPRAENAFSLLKQASSHLLDEEKRKALDETVMSARVMCLKDLGLPPDTTSDDPRLQRLAPSFDERVRKGTKEIMIDDELRRRRAIRLQHAAEGEEMRKREEAAEERKRKAEEKDDWEKNRDSRINDWRSFQKGGKSKKKKSNSNIPTLG